MNIRIIFAVLFLLLGKAEAQYRFDDGTLSLRISENNTYGFVDVNDQWIIPARFDEAEPLPAANAAIVRNGSEFRFIDSKGSWLNKLVFEKVWLCGNNPKLVCYAKLKGKWGAIGPDFRTVIPFEYEVKPEDEFTTFYVDGMSYLDAQSWLICSRKGKYGVISSQNEVIKPFKYEAIIPVGPGANPKILILKQKGKWGIEYLGSERFPDFQYTDFLDTMDDSIRVFRKNDRWIYVNLYTGKEYGELKTRVYDRQNGLLDVRRNGKWGLMDLKGNIVTEFLSDWVQPHAQIILKYDFMPSLFQHITLKYGMLDKKGKLLMEPEFLSISPVESSFLVERETGFGLLTADGKWTLETIYPEINYLSPELLAAKTKSGYLIVNHEGKPIYAEPVEEVHYMGSLISMKQNNKWGVMTIDGKTVIPPRFDEMDEHFSNGICLVKLNGLYGAIDEQGKTLIPFIYEEIDPDFNYFYNSDIERFKSQGVWQVIIKPD